MKYEIMKYVLTVAQVFFFLLLKTKKNSDKNIQKLTQTEIIA